MQIAKTNLDIIREPLVKPFGFKGGYFTEKWICEVELESNTGQKAAGQGGLAVLWSDSDVFAAHTETGGNIIMVAMLEYALQIVKGKSFETPVDMLDYLLEPVYKYGCVVTSNKNLRRTFALNALVALDNAAWILYARENSIDTFDNMVPEEYRSVLSTRCKTLASIPLITYKISTEELTNIVQEGYFFIKIKIGQPGDQQQMLKADMNRLSEIHSTIGGFRTPYTENGKLLYYLDANGRYESKDILKRLLCHAQRIGAFEQITILEEPFDEKVDIAVDDLGVRVAGDESCHEVEDVKRKLDLGYSAIALKPAGKTLSMSLKMAIAAHNYNIPCYVADSACTPILVEWNKNVAARLATLSGMKIGILESNGPHYYRRWNELIEKHPCSKAPWLQAKDGIFKLTKDYYEKSGGIFIGP